MQDKTAAPHYQPPGKRGEYLVAIQFLLIFGFIALPVMPTIPNSLALFIPEPLRWSVLILFSATAMIFGSLGSRHLKEVLTPLPYPVEHSRLITTGIYSLVRHPLYSSQLFLATGWAVFSLSLSHLLLTLFALAFFSFKASREEKWLTLRHPEYANYRKRVKKFIPWIY
ncbi:MAG: isoprenylcysteine carboxylmethyltransferase family protein [Candidatus Chlorobium antarcticum]|jgi:protein-S-isoprenylcysteine O-methyltransferase Ste14|nr:isoprenylcysteine carboxylmethyltransferase family protein [Candidatus Chlorobium antarcticum]